MSHTVLIVGGGGSVGSHVARLLASGGKLDVIVAGRNLKNAQEVAATIGARARRFDISKRADWDAALSGIDLVLVCVDQEDVGFAAHVLSRGIHYVDITAGDAFFRAVEALTPEGVRATAVLSVGLAPGITNLLARDAASRLDATDSIDIGLLLGLGDTHGRAAIEWTVREIFAPRRARPARMQFGEPWSARRAYWMDFADQHALRRTMPGVQATTRLAFDSRLMTASLFFLGSLCQGNGALMRLVSRLSPMLAFGSDDYVAVVEAHGQRDGKPATVRSRFCGRREADVTARVATFVVRSVLGRPQRNGIFHIHQLLAPTELFAALELEAAGKFTRSL